MTRVVSSAVVITGLVLTLGGATSWGQVPSTNDTSDANNNTGGGTGALGSPLFSGSANTAYGAAALFSNTDASANTAYGFDALFSNTSGSSNAAVGAGALAKNSTGDDNTAVGASALQLNTTGNFNTAVGFSALGSNV